MAVWMVSWVSCVCGYVNHLFSLLCCPSCYYMLYYGTGLRVSQRLIIDVVASARLSKNGGDSVEFSVEINICICMSFVSFTMLPT